MLTLTAARVIHCRSCRMSFHELLPSQFDAHVRVISSALRLSPSDCRLYRVNQSTRLTAVTLTRTLDAVSDSVAAAEAAAAVVVHWQLHHPRRPLQLCLVA